MPSSPADAPKIKRAVLAYSGGLDTSIIIPWLRENYGCEVIAMVGDVGQGDNFEAVRKKALATGAAKVFVEDLREEFITGYLWKAIKAGAVYEGKYLLGTSLARPVLAKAQVEVALQCGADTLAHGCTGKGNDQVRFELTYKALAPHLRVIAPWREWSIKSREDAIDYAHRHHVPVPVTKKEPYSRDQNIWHLSHEGGPLETKLGEPPQGAWKLTRSPFEAPDRETEVTIGFEAGLPLSVNGEKLGSLGLLEALNAVAGENGVGRTDLVENRLVGMKSHGAYETPAGTLLYAAHHELEALCLDRETFHYKQHLALKYAELVYYGQWFTPLRKALDAFIESTQRHVTGEVTLGLYKGSVRVLDRRSPYSLYDASIGSFTMGERYDQKDAEGFINIFGLPMMIASVKSGDPAWRDADREGELVGARGEQARPAGPAAGDVKPWPDPFPASRDDAKPSRRKR
ncbi:MAG TPA: argininosuccinate synthase [Terriglobia bacterium]|nr:argininosuccinate synthase [Terriglobia bacterium]